MKIDEILQNFMQAEEQGNLQLALAILQKALINFPQEGSYLLSELAELYYRHDYHLESIRALIKCYRQTKLEDIKELLLYRYYQPNQELFQCNYEKNCASLLQYPFYYGDKMKEFINIPEKIIWLDQERIIYLGEAHFQEYYFFPVYVNNLQSNEIVFMSNNFTVEKTLELEKFMERTTFLWCKIPFYLYYETELWHVFLQVNHIQPLIDVERIVFLIGEKHLSMFFQEMQAIWPQKTVGDMNKIQPVLNTLQKKRLTDWRKSLDAIPQYYAENGKKIISRIKAGKIRILFLTCRFSTAVQYHTRDCKLACEKLGLETDLLIEKSDIHRITDMYIRIDEFKPDIIFCIDHFRFEYPEISPEVIFVTWIQDDMPFIRDPATPSKLTKQDFILNFFVSQTKIFNVDYDRSYLIDAHIPGNELIYKKYTLNKKEIEQYSCDICIVANGSNYYQKVQSYLAQISNQEVKKFMKERCDLYYQNLLKGIILYSRSEIEDFIMNEAKKYKVVLENIEKFDFIIEEFYVKISYSALKSALPEWLIEAGYKNIKLWGQDWPFQDKLKEYAMGGAENGTVLSKILQSSKIVIGVHSHTTAPARLSETLLSGAFYLAHYIPPEYDICDIRKLLKEQEELIFFYGKHDFLDKIAYYLDHPQERKKMAQIGQKKALEKLTYKQLMKNMIKEIQKRLSSE